VSATFKLRDVSSFRNLCVSVYLLTAVLQYRFSHTHYYVIILKQRVIGILHLVTKIVDVNSLSGRNAAFREQT
jgi:TctA family transporter